MSVFPTLLLVGSAAFVAGVAMALVTVTFGGAMALAVGSLVNTFLAPIILDEFHRWRGRRHD